MKTTILSHIFILCLYMNLFPGEIETFKEYVNYKIGDNNLFLSPQLVKSAQVKKDKKISNRTIYSQVTVTINKNEIAISYNPGPSGDPTFEITHENGKVYLEGETLYISTSGYFYLNRYANEAFEKKMKFKLILLC